MGRFAVKLKLANDQDMTRAADGTIPADQIRTAEIDGVVDTGATLMVLPLAVAERLGLPHGGKTFVKYADQRRVERTVATHLDLTVCGRNAVFNAILEPDRTTALIGAVVMEVLDLLVDPGKQQLFPRDPAGTISEVE